MLTIRMSRHGAKKRPFYRFIEKVGTYNPMLDKTDPKRYTVLEERIKYWVKCGAQPSERVARILASLNLGPKVEQRKTPQKSAPKAKAQERIKAAEEAKNAAKEAANAPAAEEAPAA